MAKKQTESIPGITLDEDSRPIRPGDVASAFTESDEHPARHSRRMNSIKDYLGKLESSVRLLKGEVETLRDSYANELAGLKADHKTALDEEKAEVKRLEEKLKRVQLTLA